METIITLRNLSVQIETNDVVLKGLIERFLLSTYSQTVEQAKDEDDKIIVYGSIVKPYTSFTISNIQFGLLLNNLKFHNYDISKATPVYKRDLPFDKVDYKCRPNWQLRDKQIGPYEFIMDDPTGIKLLPLVTGTGKTFIALYILAKLKKRFAVVIEPKFIDKWIEDIKEIHEATDDDIVVIQGMQALKDLINLKREGRFPYKYIIISVVTFRIYIKAFEEDTDYAIEMMGGITPYEYFPTLGVGIILIDELHLSYNAHMKTILFSSVSFILTLTATLIPNSDLEERAYGAYFNTSNTYHDDMLVRYLNVHPKSFHICPQFLKNISHKVKGGPFNGAYSHGNFEKSIMRNKRILKAYTELIVGTVKEDYIDRYLPGDKAIIFVQSIKLASHLTKIFSMLFPDKVVRRYVEKDSYDELMKADIMFSTALSAGTGFDIPGLRYALNTVSEASLRRNIQVSGRLRYLDDRDVRYTYLWSPQIPKQREYHHLRMRLYREKAKDIFPTISRWALE